MSFLYIVSEKKKGRQFNERVHTQVEWMRQKAILLPVFFFALGKDTFPAVRKGDCMKQVRHYGLTERPPLSLWFPLSFQHVFAMFGSTVVVFILVGLNPSTALFTAGTGTLIYILCTKAKVPAFLGSSFSFIAPMIAVAAEYGMPYAMGGAMFSGLFYCLIALIIKLCGHAWLNRALPPVVIGSVIVTIGLSLAPSAMQNAMFDAQGTYQIAYFIIAIFTLVLTITASMFFKGFLSSLPILIGLIGGYLFTVIMGAFFPAFDIIDLQRVRDAAWIGLLKFRIPKFGIAPIITFILISFATICEHLGDTLCISKVVEKDFYEDPGLHKTLLGDGLATSWASLWGGPPNTTYGENVGVLAVTRNYSVWITGGAAVIAVILSLCQKFGALIRTILGPVLGGMSMLLYGTIASSGLRTLVESGVDYRNTRNLIISSVILVIGIGGGMLQFEIGNGLTFQLGGIALATLIGVILNLVLPNKAASERTDE